MERNTAWDGFLARFRGILDALDEFEPDEDLEELNAQLEDALFWTEDDDTQEAARLAVEEIGGLLAEYRALSGRRPELRQKVLELEMAVQWAERSLR